MDVQHFLAVNMMVISALAAVMSLMQPGPRGNRLWLAVNVAVVLTGLVALQVAPLTAGMIVGAIFVPLVLGPFVLIQLSQRATLKGSPRAAALYSGLLSLLHPTRRARLDAAIRRADARPSVPEQVAALEAIAADASPSERISLNGHKLLAEGDWQGLLDHFARHQEEIVDVGVLEIRALGELGRTDDMADAFEAKRQRLAGPDLATAQLFVLAFGGRVEAVSEILKGPLSALGDEAKVYWNSIAARAAGVAPDVWQQPLRAALASSRNVTFRLRAERVLANTASGWASRTGRTEAIFDRAAQRLQQTTGERRTGFMAAPVTWLLLLAIGAVYLLEEYRGGSESLRNLVEMGAMWPPYIERRGEYWRLFTAIFLHLGPLHAGVNALMLWILGRPSEQSLGSIRVLVVFLVGGVASSAFVFWLAWSRYTDAAALVGASGAVMALFGALVASKLTAWMRDPESLDRRTLVMLAAVMVLQVLADLSSPQVSLAAHVSGFAAGFLLGLVLTATMRDRPQRDAD